MMLRFVFLWSWRRPSAERTNAKYAFMAVTQEPRRELRAVVAAANPGGVETDNAARLERQFNSVDLRPALADITCPALVLYGTRDSVMVAGGELLTAGLPNCETLVLDDVGHEPFIEAPDETFAALRTFLQ
jgi:pimeloyl-ACP methyl ester carboxylesterase